MFTFRNSHEPPFWILSYQMITATFGEQKILVADIQNRKSHEFQNGDVWEI